MVGKEIRNILKMALAEDIGTGDITTQATVGRGKRGRAWVVAKGEFIVAGTYIFAETFRLLDKNVRVKIIVSDGNRVEKGGVIAEISGSLFYLLQAERVALNILQRMSGIATVTARYVRAVRSTKAKILDTRKTAPGLRVLDKMAVRMGGGTNHRMGLYDGVLIKDNHIEAAGGITAAIEAQRKKLPQGRKIEVETRNIREVKEALACGVDIILLDNMTVSCMKRAVGLAAGRALLEASGNVNLRRVAAIAATGVDYISVGELTHSVHAADISLKIRTMPESSRS